MNTWNVWLGFYIFACIAWTLFCAWVCETRDRSNLEGAQAVVAGCALIGGMMLAVKLIWFW